MQGIGAICTEFENQKAVYRKSTEFIIPLNGRGLCRNLHSFSPEDSVWVY